MTEHKQERNELTAAMDNALAWRLGEIAREAMMNPGGDLIDTGLNLLRLLNERDFHIYYTGPKPL